MRPSLLTKVKKKTICSGSVNTADSVSNSLRYRLKKGKTKEKCWNAISVENKVRRYVGTSGT